MTRRGIERFGRKIRENFSTQRSKDSIKTFEFIKKIQPIRDELAIIGFRLETPVFRNFDDVCEATVHLTGRQSKKAEAKKLLEQAGIEILNEFNWYEAQRTVNPLMAEKNFSPEEVQEMKQDTVLVLLKIAHYTNEMYNQLEPHQSPQGIGLEIW